MEKKYYVHCTLEISNHPPHSRYTVNRQSSLFTVLPKSTNFSFQSKNHSRGEIKVGSNNFWWVLLYFQAGGASTNNLQSCDFAEKNQHLLKQMHAFPAHCTVAAHFFGTQGVKDRLRTAGPPHTAVVPK